MKGIGMIAVLGNEQLMQAKSEGKQRLTEWMLAYDWSYIFIWGKWIAASSDSQDFYRMACVFNKDCAMNVFIATLRTSFDTHRPVTSL